MEMMINYSHKAASWNDMDRLHVTKNNVHVNVNDNVNDSTSTEVGGGGGNTLSLLMLYGSWNSTLIRHTSATYNTNTNTNTNTHSHEEEEAIALTSHRKTLLELLSSIISKNPSYFSSTSIAAVDDKSHAQAQAQVQVLSLKVDQDDDTMDICISDHASNKQMNHLKDDDGDVNMTTADNDNHNNKSNNNNSNNNNNNNNNIQIQAPENLPALILVDQKLVVHNIKFDHSQLIHYLLHNEASPYRNDLYRAIQGVISPSTSISPSQSISFIPLPSSVNFLPPSFTTKATTAATNAATTTSTATSTSQKEQHQPKQNQNNKNQTKRSLNIPNTSININPPIRIFIAGDKSQVGKSSICLGLIGTLITKYKIKPSSIAYIKPATQCEESQLIAKYCDTHHIPNVPVGPIVYYKGFTRAYLNGQTDDSTTLLHNVKRAVDDISVGKDIVIIDGVGYPAVGSICGTDNVSVASACGYGITNGNDNGNGNINGNNGHNGHNMISIPPAVLIVGKRGVGDAIDSYNLNATYFKARNIHVMGAIFNRLPNEPNHFYSLENCKKALTAYFDKQTQTQQHKKNNNNKNSSSSSIGMSISTSTSIDEEVFGFIPEVDGLSGSTLEGADEFIDIFSKYVNVSRILEHAVKLRDFYIQQQHQHQTQAQVQPGRNEKTDRRANNNTSNSHGDQDEEEHVQKKIKLSSTTTTTTTPHDNIQLTREQIENTAKAQGAAGG